MVYDCHGFYQRFGRSAAQKELMRRGQKVLGPIAEHLKTRPIFDKIELGMNLDTAFGYLLNQIGIKMGKEKLVDAPRQLKDVSGWGTWAQKYCVA